jgi:hypothetical protein
MLAAVLGCGSVPALCAQDRQQGQRVLSLESSVTSWIQESECRWWLRGGDGTSHRASIGPGEEALLLSISDAIFLTWPEEERPRIEIVFDDDPVRTVSTEAWVTHGANDVSTLGAYLDAPAARKLAGATHLTLRRNGQTVITLPLAGTPGSMALDACIPPPLSENSDQE